MPRDQATIYRPPHVTRPVSENKLHLDKPAEAPRTPAADPRSYEFQRNAAHFHQAESRLNSPGMLQQQFEANAARFHANTPVKKDPAAFRMDPLFPQQREQKPPPDSASSQFKKSAAQFYAVTPPQSSAASKPASRHSEVPPSSHPPSSRQSAQSSH